MSRFQAYIAGGGGSKRRAWQDQLESQVLLKWNFGLAWQLNARTISSFANFEDWFKSWGNLISPRPCHNQLKQDTADETLGIIFHRHGPIFTSNCVVGKNWRELSVSLLGQVQLRRFSSATLRLRGHNSYVRSLYYARHNGLKSPVKKKKNSDYDTLI